MCNEAICEDKPLMEFDMTQSEFHRYRIRVIETWRDGPEKQSALAAACAAFECEVAFEASVRDARRNQGAFTRTVAAPAFSSTLRNFPARGRQERPYRLERSQLAA